MNIQRSIYFKGNTLKPYKLIKSEQVFIIKTIANNDSEEILKKTVGGNFFEEKIKLISRFEDSYVTIYRLNGTKEQLEDLKKNVRSKFENQIEYIGSTLEYQNSNAYQVYTGNIYIEFNESCPNHFCLKFLEENNLINKNSLNFGDNCFFCKPKTSLGIEIFNFCEKLLDLPEVNSCHPELVTELRAQKSYDIIYNREVDEKFLESLKEDWWLEQVSIKNAWKNSQGENTIIAVIDDGIELDHKAFKLKIMAFLPITLMTNMVHLLLALLVLQILMRWGWHPRQN